MAEIEYRNLFLCDYIEQNSVKEIIEKILKINDDDEKKEKEYKEFKREPIMLLINSFGGSVYDGLSLIDVIERSKTPVFTICVGSAMSMALLIFLSGQKRFIGKNATLMFHDVTTYVWDKTETIKQVLDEALRLQNLLIKNITSKTTIAESKLRDYINRKAEWYITPDEAIKFGLAHDYY